MNKMQEACRSEIPRNSCKPFDAIFILGARRTIAPPILNNRLSKLNLNIKNYSLSRWNICGNDCWVGTAKHQRSIHRTLRALDGNAFGTYDLLGPLKSVQGSDVEETALPTID